MSAQEDNTVKIKVYKNNNWMWHNIEFKTKSLEHIDMKGFKEINPSLVNSDKYYQIFLQKLFIFWEMIKYTISERE
ncbi:hypothetical protein V7D15_09005 [Thermoanaerobacter thermohydrosulfuricus]